MQAVQAAALLAAVCFGMLRAACWASCVWCAGRVVRAFAALALAGVVGTTGWGVGHGEGATGSARAKLLRSVLRPEAVLGVAGWLLREVCGRCALWGGCSVRAGGSGACRSLSIAWVAIRVGGACW